MMAEKMKVASIYRFDLLSLGVGVLIGCFLVSLTYVTMYKSDMLAFPSATSMFLFHSLLNFSFLVLFFVVAQRSMLVAVASQMSKADVYSWISRQVGERKQNQKMIDLCFERRL